MTLHYVVNGEPDRPLMLFVHGFPECWYTWRFQMQHFAKNYRCVAIDQRGYGLSSKPPNVADYKIDLLSRDIADVVEQLGALHHSPLYLHPLVSAFCLGYKTCVLVGHDWGAVVSWTVAML